MTSFVKATSRGGGSKPISVSQLFSQFRLDSFTKELEVDRDSSKHFPNSKPREVHSGHFVLTQPQPITNPFLVCGSKYFATECLGLDPAEFASETFAKVFAGDISAIGNGLNDSNHKLSEPLAQPWATPYAVSVFGQPILAPDPFGTGNGYGDGRAMSIGEFQGVNGTKWELQLKGCGTTPFSRGADGRAVLRSSVREYLVSNAMHHLGVPTTMALSLVASRDMTVDRPWYPPEYRGREVPPMVMQTEQCAITCRASSSFIRLGQVELFSRRASRGVPGAKEQLAQLVNHAIQREFPEILNSDSSSELSSSIEPSHVVMFLREVMLRLSRTAVEWVRVGYVQGNMNSDNMLVNGNTLDYGPFGFVEKFSPLWSPFTSDPEKKFGFLRQPMAMQLNVVTLARALVPLIMDVEGSDDYIDEMQSIVGDEYRVRVEQLMLEMRCKKLGLEVPSDFDSSEAKEVAKLWEKLVELMTSSQTDYTKLFRQLSQFHDVPKDTDEKVPEVLSDCFYKPLEGVNKEFGREWNKWLLEWKKTTTPNYDLMQQSNPKFVPREWILVEAYSKAEKGDFSIVEELEKVFQNPYDEQSDELTSNYFSLTPSEMRNKGGVAFFS